MVSSVLFLSLNYSYEYIYDRCPSGNGNNQSWKRLFPIQPQFSTFSKLKTCGQWIRHVFRRLKNPFRRLKNPFRPWLCKKKGFCGASRYVYSVCLINSLDVIQFSAKKLALKKICMGTSFKNSYRYLHTIYTIQYLQYGVPTFLRLASKHWHSKITLNWYKFVLF
jgi:hypothetical protein